MTTGTPARSSSPWTNATVDGVAPDARPDGDHVRVQLEQAIERGEVDAPEGVSSSDSVMYSGAMDATMAAHDRGVAMVTRPAPGAQCPDRGEMGGTGSSARACHDQHAAEVPLVRFRGARRNDLPHPLAREQLEIRPVEVIDDRMRDADVGDDQIAGMGIGRRKNQRNFRRGQRDRHRCLDRDAVELCSIRGQAGRQIDGDNRHASALTSATTVCSSPVSSPWKPVPSIASTMTLTLRDLAEVELPLLRAGDLDDGQPDAPQHLDVRAGISLHFADAADQEHRRVDAALHQRARDDEAVAAVVAASAQHRHAAHREILERCFHRRDRLASGVLHQHDRRDADLVDRATICLAHLLGVEHAHRKVSLTPCVRLRNHLLHNSNF